MNMFDDDMDEEIDVDVGELSPKRVKKHKKHKQKKKKDDVSEDVSLAEESDNSQQMGIKLKIKFGKGDGTPPKKVKTQGSEKRKDADVFKTKKSDEDTSDEEKEWLKALESGNLDDNGLLKRAKDPLLMTARQRSKLQGKPEEELMQLPSGYKTNKMSEEQLQRRQHRAQKRREAAQEKREKDKKKTVDRLLKKQETKRGAAKAAKSRGGRKTKVPGFRYQSTINGVVINVPEGLEFPLARASVAVPLPAKKCGIAGCSNPKKYNCSKTGIPLCSLDCYKKNLELNVRNGEGRVT